MVNLMADTMTSPTAYMQAYLRQRGWQLPEETLTIPNVMPVFQEQPSALRPLQDVRQASQATAPTLPPVEMPTTILLLTPGGSCLYEWHARKCVCGG